MKKKIAITAVVFFLLTFVGYGTYAYMTAQTTAQNIITAGTVKIQLNEAPVGLKVMPATQAQREITVKNIGANPCYVRVRLDTQLQSATEESLDMTGKIILSMGSDWVKDSEGFWRYSKKLAPGETSSNLLTGIAFDKSMGNEYQNATFHLSVGAQAVQAANNGFAVSVLEVSGWPAAPAPSPAIPG